jgi:PD-(D/E)XK endonuclease
MGLLAPKRRVDKKALGDQSEIIVTARLMKAGYTVLKPYGDHTRYDMVIEDANGQFWRLQCKTAWLSDGGSTLQFRPCSMHYHYTPEHGKKDYRGQADYFVVYSPDLDTVYLFPVDQVGVSLVSLRLAPSKNNQSKSVRWASEYEL